LTDTFWEKRRTRLLLAGVAALLGFQAQVLAQTSGPAAGRAGASIDLTGYWESVITSMDWRLRMVTPAKGDFLGFSLTPEAIKVANAWDPARDDAEGNQCKSYGAAGIMRLPERLHITWQDDKTLRMDIDAGIQTRLFHFGEWKAPPGEATWQGESVARWDTSWSGGLKVTTRHMRAGYLRKNGIPYSENALLTEYYDVVRGRSGDRLLIVTSVVEDPMYLRQPYSVSNQFKKQADSHGWDPTPCSSRW
jgi:hypothetical protein